MMRLSTCLVLVLVSLGCTAPVGNAPSARTSDVPTTPPVVTPPGSTDLCGDGLDGDVDGQVDEGCPCEVGTTQPCWPGDPSKRGIAPCVDGLQECVPNGEFATWGECWGATLPTAAGECLPSRCAMSELGGCSDGEDDDCDGLIDCEDSDCAVATVCGDDPVPDGGGSGDCRCVPGTTRYCHVDVSCEWGSQVCRTDGAWDTCNPMGWGVTPPGCAIGDGFDPFLDDWGYDVQCCVRNGYCCDNLAWDYTLYDPSLSEHASVGNCAAQCVSP